MSSEETTLPQHCPCCSGKPYTDCCQPLIYGKKRALTPEALMRSRYTAYTQANIDYIEKTMRGKAAKHFNRHEAMMWARGLEWVKLDVTEAPPVQAGKRHATVTFVAHYKSKNNPQTLTERSEFQLRKGRWYYTGYQET